MPFMIVTAATLHPLPLPQPILQHATATTNVVAIREFRSHGTQTTEIEVPTVQFTHVNFAQTCNISLKNSVLHKVV